MTITTPFLDPKAFMSSLHKDYDFSYSKQWHTHHLEMPENLGNGSMQVFIREQIYFIRLNLKTKTPIGFYSPDKVGGNGLIDFRFNAAGEQFSAVLEKKEKYETEIKGKNWFAIFIPPSAISCNKKDMLKKFNKSFYNPDIQALAKGLFQVPADNFDAHFLLEGKFLQFIHTWLDFFNNIDISNDYYQLPAYKIKSLALIKSIMDEQLMEPPSLKELSKIAGMNINDLQENFKKLNGITIRQYLIKQRMQSAKKLVLHSDLPITQICMQTGYANRGHFSQLYYNFFGHSPLQHRRSLNLTC